MVALSSLSVNTERDPPEAQNAVANLIKAFSQIRTAVFLFHHRFAAVPLPLRGRFGCGVL